MATNQIRGNTQIIAGTITNAEINASAAISADKIANGSTNSIITLTQETNFESAYTHVSNNGSDHSFIDQSVVSGAAPTFTADNFSDGGSNAIITTTQETNFETAYTHSQVSTGNPHSVTAAEVGAIATGLKGANNGVAELDASGQVPASQLTITAMEYKGGWAASTNTPTLADGTGNTGDVYFASDAGTVDFGAGNITFASGDWVIYSGSIWEKSTNSNAVTSVNSETGAVTLDADDISDAATTNKFVTAADITVLGNTSGTNSGDEVSATDSAEGIIELATQSEVDTGTDTSRAVTPATLASYSGLPSVPDFADGETPSGLINSSNTDYDCANAPSPAGSLKVYLNGVRQRLTTDYTLSSATITMTTAPTTGDNLLVDYRY